MNTKMSGILQVLNKTNSIMTEGDIILSLKNISKSFPQRGSVLDSLCLDIYSGQTIAIMGPSGSGKTTLMNIIGLLDKPDAGEIFFRGKPVSGFKGNESARYRSRQIGFVFQDHLLLPYLTIRENIYLPLMAAGYTKEEFAGREAHLSSLMEMTGIESLSGKYPFQISGGEAQRAALVRALANTPSVLLADEPTGSLDTANASMLGKLMLSMNSEFGTSLIVATHSTGLAKEMSHILRLENGRLTGS
jgi:lipoprotein-releasing system ATP-binding protein